MYQGRGEGGRWSVWIATNASIVMPAEGDILDPLRKLKGIYLMSALIRKITSAFLLLFTVRLEYLAFVIVHTLGPIMIIIGR